MYIHFQNYRSAEFLRNVINLLSFAPASHFGASAHVVIDCLYPFRTGSSRQLEAGTRMAGD